MTLNDIGPIVVHLRYYAECVSSQSKLWYVKLVEAKPVHTVCDRNVGTVPINYREIVR